MRILYVLDTYPSFSETFIAREIAALRRRGHTIEVMALRPGDGERVIPIHRSSMRRLRMQVERRVLGAPSARSFQALGQAAWSAAIGEGALRDIEHIHAGWASHPAEIARGMAGLAGLSWSFSGHARDLFVEGGDLAGKLASACFAACCTHAGVELLLSVASESRSKVLFVPHGLPLAEFPFLESMPMDEIKLLSVGRLVEKKGYPILLEALAQLARDGTRFSATVVGAGPLRRSLLAQRARLGLDAVVHFPGAMPPEDVPMAMRDYNCLVSANVRAGDGDRDGLPNTIIEAAARGLPLVASRVGAIEDFVDKQIGRLCPSGDAGALAAAIRARTR